VVARPPTPIVGAGGGIVPSRTLGAVALSSGRRDRRPLGKQGIAADCNLHAAQLTNSLGNDANDSDEVPKPSRQRAMRGAPAREQRDCS